MHTVIITKLPYHTKISTKIAIILVRIESNISFYKYYTVVILFISYLRYRALKVKNPQQKITFKRYFRDQLKTKDWMNAFRIIPSKRKI